MIERKISEIENEYNRLIKKEFNISEKLIYICLGSFFVLMVIGYVDFLMGRNYFMLPNFGRKENHIIVFVVSTAMFLVNIFFLLGISLQEFNKKVFLFTGLYIIIYLFPSFVGINANFTLSVLVPTAYCIIICIFMKKPLIKALIIPIATMSFIVLYQYFEMTIKMGMVPHLKYTDLSLIQAMFLQIDFVLLLIIIYAKGVVENGYSTEKYWFISERFCVLEDDRSGERELAEYLKSLSKLKWIIAISKITIVQIIQLFTVLLICKIGNVLAEILVILPVFWLARAVLKRSWHSNSIINCTIISSIVFYGGCRITLPLNLSMFFPVITGLVIAYTLFRVAIYTDDYRTMKLMLDEFKQKELEKKKFKLYKGMPKQALIDECTTRGLNELQIKLLVWKWSDKLSITKEILPRMHPMGTTKLFKLIRDAENNF